MNHTTILIPSKTTSPLKILISGASFAGLSAAYWMARFGHEVTVVEIGSSLKKGGTPVDIREQAVEVVKRMGLYEAIWSKRLQMEGLAYKNADDSVIGSMAADHDQEEAQEECEIERDVLLNMIYEQVQPWVEWVYSDSIKSIHQNQQQVIVDFHKGGTRSFDLIFGCDGIHSAVRRAVFGEESQFTHFLGGYFSIAIADELLIKENTTELYNEPGKAIMLNAYNRRTDMVFSFRSQEEIDYNYRDGAAQRAIVKAHYASVGWRAPELLSRLLEAKDFYFDKFCQIKMPSWTNGRVVLLGDAGYCASPAAGMGGSLAIIGAAVLADAFEEAGGDFGVAFNIYNERLRPYVEMVQRRAVDFAKDTFLPQTQEAIDQRNVRVSAS